VEIKETENVRSSFDVHRSEINEGTTPGLIARKGSMVNLLDRENPFKSVTKSLFKQVATPLGKYPARYNNGLETQKKNKREHEESDQGFGSPINWQLLLAKQNVDRHAPPQHCLMQTDVLRLAGRKSNANTSLNNTRGSVEVASIAQASANCSSVQQEVCSKPYCGPRHRNALQFNVGNKLWLNSNEIIMPLNQRRGTQIQINLDGQILKGEQRRLNAVPNVSGGYK